MFDEIMNFACTCKHFNPKLSHNGNCDKQGYAPFDCKHCSSYKEKAQNNKVRGVRNNESNDYFTTV